MSFTKRLALCLLPFLLAVCLRADVDTDGDGVTDSEETIAGTDPLNSQSVPWRSLASWRFSDGTLTGDNGQQPITQSNVVVIPNGFSGPAVKLLPNAAPVSLKYRAVEPSGKPNISAVRGSILFRILPTWTSGSGPGTTVTVLQTTNFALLFNPTGTTLTLTSGNGASTITNIQISVDIGSFELNWNYGLLTYSPEETSLTFAWPNTRLTGPGITPPANFNDPNNFIAIGSAANGTGPINGSIDEIVTFNAPGLLLTNAWQFSAIASNNPVGLHLVWNSATNAITEFRRRVVGASNWDVTRATIGTNFFDTAGITVGERYEYNFNTGIEEVFEKVGAYIKASVAGVPLHQNGKVILLVDKTLTNAIEAELGGFITNLVGDGWEVLRLNVPRHIDDYSSPTSYKTNFYNITNVIVPYIRSNYTAFGSEIKQIICIGHVPVGYTGTRAEDGHTFHDPSVNSYIHTGAWACDHYLGDIDGIWTDNVTVIDSEFSENRNYPGDGKLDQNVLPPNASGIAKLEIPVARIDLSKLIAYSATEAELMIKYFKKNADYRFAVRPFAKEAMAAEWILAQSTTAYELPTAMLSRQSVLKQIQVGDIFTSNASMLFGVQSAGSGPNIIFSHSTAELATGTVATNCAFFFVRGSYFPDWNSGDNLLRSILGLPNGGLAAGAFLEMLDKSWRADGLAVGFSIGNEVPATIEDAIKAGLHSTRLAELMGDPTLRYPVLVRPGPVTSAVTNRSVSLAWSHGSRLPATFFVYRSTNGVMGKFERLTPTDLTTTNFTDLNPPAGKLVYMIRNAALAVTGGGTYTNLSQGVFSPTITSVDPVGCCIADMEIPEDSELPPVPFSIGEAAGLPGLTVTATSSNPTLLPDTNIELNGSGEVWTLQATPETNRSGVATITIKAQAEGVLVVKSFQLTVTPVNDAPTFTKGPDQAVAQQSGAQSVSSWATDISPGPTDEAAQQLTFVVTTEESHLFSVQPAISNTGTLTYTPAPDQRGVANIAVELKDDGGTDNSGQDTSYPQNFTITIGLPQDSDGDGLPDDFEAAYGFDPDSPGDGDVDWDGDGMTNLQELAAGTNPTNSLSAFRISSAASQSPTFEIVFSTVAGRNYSLDANDSFPTNETWQTLATPIAGTGLPVQKLDTDAGNSDRRIYRLVTTGSGSAEVQTEYAGFCRLPLLGNSDTFVSIPFFRPAEDLGAVVSLSANTVELRGPPSWEVGQWVYSSGTQSNTYFMLVRSGAAAGNWFTITANGASTLTLDADPSALGNLHAGDAVAVIPYWTMGTVFPGGEGIHASTGLATRKTEVLFPNIGGTGVNLSAAGTYYFLNGTWRKVGEGNLIKNNDVILPDMYIIVRHNINSNTVLTTEGAVLAGRIRTDVRRSISFRQDNLVALPRPVSITLAQSELVSSGAFRPSTGLAGRVDELLVFNNSAVGKNKSAAATYYYLNNAWRVVGGGLTDHGGDLVFRPGEAVILRSGTGSSSAVWSNDPIY